MNDIFHEWGNDLVANSSGDLALATGSATISQRVCRRLLTNPGEYIWNRDYGGGLARFVGAPAKSADIEALIRTQLLLEAAVPSSPPPQVAIIDSDLIDGNLIASIIYADPISLLPVTLNVTAG